MENTLSVPYLKALDILDLSSVGYILETKATRVFINKKIYPDEYPYCPICSVNIARGEKDLYMHFFVRGNSLKAICKEDNSRVYEDSCVSFFMKKTNTDLYMNFDFNCCGVCNAARRLSERAKESLTPREYASIRRYSTIKSKVFSEQRGVYTWELIVAIPWVLMGLNPENLPDVFEGNFYKRADLTISPHYLSWSPVKNTALNFHDIASFGKIVL
ncbi:carbohydrate-binding family 9-like protein [Parabacteroides pacaensis]|uniref:carbohydrate-binding family 9-like protein n=1 Tax=Parabacteroides pacaensis TaxID=2086575 RepID=UPI000D10B539|nr:carbohydrate-binding family 9-like protein [Parabacteroides pacaensis]